MESRKAWQIPSFGNWDYCDQLPITQFFESARQAAYDDDYLKVPVAMPVNLAYHRRKARKDKFSTGERVLSKEDWRSKPVIAAGDPAGRTKTYKAASKAVDEDLYKIPPELLYQKPKKKKLWRNLFLGCLG